MTDTLEPTASRSFTYDGLDRLTAATGPSTSDTYSYSPSGNLLSKEGQPQLYTIPAHPHAVSQAIGLSMSYDAAGNLTAAGDYAYTYDEEGRMSEARQGGLLLGSYEYDAAGNRVRKTVGGVQTLFFYGVEGVVTAEANGAGLLTTSYVYVGPRRVAKVNNDVDGDGVLNLSDNCPDVANPTQTDTDADNLGDACDAAPTNPDQDGDGLLDGDEVRTHHTDPANPDTDGDGASDGLEVAQGFDPLDPQSTPPLGGAVPALSAAGLALFLLLFFLSAALVRRRRRGALDRAARLYLALFVWLALQAQLSREAFAALGEYIHPDHLGSTRVLRDGAGNETRRLTYKPFGDTASDTGAGEIRYEYAGGALDAETGLYYLGARYYAPSIGRFLQPDDLGDPFDPQSLNRYTYARNNPVMFLDPTGQFFGFFAAFFGFLGGVLGGTANLIGGFASGLTGVNLSSLPVLGGVFSADSGAFFLGQQLGSFAATVASQRRPGFSLGDAGVLGVEVGSAVSGARSPLIRSVSAEAGEAVVEQVSEAQQSEPPRTEAETQALLDRLNAQLGDPNGSREVSLDEIFDTNQFGGRTATLSDVKFKKGRFEGRFVSIGKKQLVQVPGKPGSPARVLSISNQLDGKFGLGKSELLLGDINGATAIGAGFRGSNATLRGIRITPSGGMEGAGRVGGFR